ncbi:MAG: hypothetical protein ACJAVC_001260 [Brevundimonas sp.]|jgi:hypothetical protein
MRIRITAGGIYDGEGKEIPVGTELDVADFDVNDEGQPVEPHPWGGRFVAIGGGKDGKTAVTNDQPPVGPFTVVDGGKGWWTIQDGKGEKVGASVREDDAKAFDTMSDDDKAAFAAEHAKA